MYQTILVPLDGSPLGEQALATAVSLAQHASARLVLVRAGRDGVTQASPTGSESDETTEARTYLDSVVTRLAASGVTALPLVVGGPPAAAIIDAIHNQGADLVIMTTHGRSGLGRWILGSVAEKVVAGSHVPVWLVRAARPLPPLDGLRPRLLVPLDGTEFAETVIPHVKRLAHNLNAEVTLLHVVEPPSLADDLLLTQPVVPPQNALVDEQEARTYLRDWTERLRLERVAATNVVREGHPADAILKESEAAGTRLIVMATHSRTGLRQALFGSVAMEVLRRAVLPLVLFNPAHAVSADS